MMGTIRIETRGSDNPALWHIFLDGTDISHFVRSFHMHAEAGERPIMRIEIVGHPDFVGEIKAEIGAYMMPENPPPAGSNP